MQDNIVTLINKYLSREATEDEKMRLSCWLEESEENRRFYSLFAANCSLHKTITSPDLNSELESMMMRLHARIDEADAQRPRFPRKAFAWAMSVAAAVALLVLAIGNFWRPQQTAPVEPPMELASNLTENTVHIVLDDGTQVYLHPGASIRYNVSTISGRREVRLSGDAYFDVTRDEARPFVVRTPNIGVRVLGTSFSVSGAPTINVLSAPSSETSVTPLATTAREAVFAALPANDAACLIVPSPYSPGATWTVSPDLW